MDQESIIARAVGFFPVLGKKVKNPFRSDEHPNCYFAWDRPGTYIRLYDWGNSTFHRMNCFDLIFYSVYKRKIVTEEDLREATRLIGSNVTLSKRPKDDFTFMLRYNTTAPTQELFDYYGEYEITKANLIDDQVFQVAEYSYNKRTSPKLFYSHVPDDLCIALTRGSHVKIYRPFQTKESGLKFKTDCTPDDIYWWNAYESEFVFIVGSHKDGRVLANWEYPTVAFQSESAVPSHDILQQIVGKHKKLLYIGDIDHGGLDHAKSVLKRLEGLPIEHRPLPLHLLQYNIKDVAEFKRRGGTKAQINGFLLSGY